MKLIQTLHVYATQYSHNLSKEIEITNREIKNTAFQTVSLLSTTEIEVEISEDYEVQLDLQIIENLKDQKMKILADAELSANLLQRRINELQALENKGK